MPINVSVIEANFENGAIVSPKTLVAMGVVSSLRKKSPLIKILGTGVLTKKVTIEGCMISASAQLKVETAGGKVLK